MAERISFSKRIILSDSFINLPITAQCLYIQLNAAAYDKGLVINARTTAKATGSSLEDLDLLVSCGFLQEVEDGHFLITHWNENNGIGENANERNTFAYREWRKAVIARDGRCMQCGSKDKLVAHHIKSFALYPDLRTDIDNGITLCEKCHMKLHGLEKKNGEEENV